MQDDAAAWERQVYTFAQHRQLPSLAPHIPIGIMAPTLRRQAYEMVRSALLEPLLGEWPWRMTVCALLSCLRRLKESNDASDGDHSPENDVWCRAQVLTAFLLSPAHHEQLLPLLKRWPPQLYSVTALTDATLHRCQPRVCTAHSALAA
jgi:hypothetical protein